MIYIDANLFIYAFFNAKKRQLSQKTQWMKSEAKKIIQKIFETQELKDQYCISIIQLSEVVNVLKSVMTWEQLQQFLIGIYSNKSIQIFEVSSLLYLSAIDKISSLKMDSNDISAYLIMKEKIIDEIYTFDSSFRLIKDIRCLPIIPNTF